MYKVVTVCTGNICRSPIAEFLLAEAFEEAGLGSHVTVESFAVSDWEQGNPMDSRAVDWLTDHEVGDPEDIRAHTSRPIGVEDLGSVQLALALDVDHLEALEDLARDLPDDDENAPVLRLLGSFNPQLADASPEKQGIYDPWGGGPQDFEAVADLIRPCVPGVVEFVRQDSACRAALNVE